MSQQQQQQRTAPNSDVGPDATLTRLQNILNNVLVLNTRQVKKAFVSGGKNISQLNAAIAASIPEHQSRYQEALDEFEIQLQDAKWVLRRDLALAQARRKEQEEAEAAAAAAARAAREEQERAEKAIMTKPEPIAQTASSKLGAAHLITHKVDQSTDTTAEEVQDIEMTEPPQEEAEAAVPLDSATVEILQTNEKAEAKDADEAPTAEKTPTTAGLNEIDFGSIFGDDATGDDAGPATGPSTGDFRMDLTESGVGNEEETANDGGVSSLLTGIESYANGGDDFAMMDMPAPADQSGGFEQQVSHEPQQDTQSSEQQQGQDVTNFDDFFFYGDEVDMENAGAGGNQGMSTQFDDNFFDL